MRGLTITILLVACVALGGACTTRSHHSAYGARLGSYLDFRSLSRKDYTVRANVMGKATVTKTNFLGFTYYSFGVPGLTEKRDSGAIHGIEMEDAPKNIPIPFAPGDPALEYAKDQAIYNALDKIPDADVLLQPRFSWKCTANWAVIYTTSSCEVTVKGKAITINEG